MAWLVYNIVCQLGPPKDNSKNFLCQVLAIKNVQYVFFLEISSCLSLDSQCDLKISRSSYISGVCNFTCIIYASPITGNFRLCNLIRMSRSQLVKGWPRSKLFLNQIFKQEIFFFCSKNSITLACLRKQLTNTNY